MGNRVCIDTDIIIDHLRGKGQGVKIFEKVIQYYAPVTTYVNKFELFCGARSKYEIGIIKETLLGFLVLAFDDTACEEAGGIYRELKTHGSLIGIRDIMIAGIAIAHNIPLATNNIKDFSRVKKVKVWS